MSVPAQPLLSARSRAFARGITLYQAPSLIYLLLVLAAAGTLSLFASHHTATAQPSILLTGVGACVLYALTLTGMITIWLRSFVSSFRVVGLSFAPFLAVNVAMLILQASMAGIPIEKGQSVVVQSISLGAMVYAITKHISLVSYGLRVHLTKPSSAVNGTVISLACTVLLFSSLGLILWTAALSEVLV